MCGYFKNSVISAAMINFVIRQCMVFIDKIVIFSLGKYPNIQFWTQLFF